MVAVDNSPSHHQSGGDWSENGVRGNAGVCSVRSVGDSSKARMPRGCSLSGLCEIRPKPPTSGRSACKLPNPTSAANSDSETQSTIALDLSRNSLRDHDAGQVWRSPRFITGTMESLAAKTIHIYRSEGAWTVKKEGKSAKTFSTQMNAVDAAKEGVKKDGVGQFVVHRGNGPIREYNCISNDSDSGPSQGNPHGIPDRASRRQNRARTGAIGYQPLQGPLG